MTQRQGRDPAMMKDVKHMVIHVGSCGCACVHYLLRVCHSTDSCVESGVGHYEGDMATTKRIHQILVGGTGIFTHRGSLMSNTIGLGGRLGDCQKRAVEQISDHLVCMVMMDCFGV